jgi:predicted DNA-binding transcriptional regulator AlpA
MQGKRLSMKSTIKNFSDIPVSLNAEDVAHFLGISRTKAHTLMNSKDFPTLHIGKRKIVIKDNFLRWIENQSNVTKLQP